MPVGAVIWRVEDPADGGALRMVRPNRGASRASGVDLRQFVGRTMAEAFPPFAESGIPDRMLEVAFHGGEPFDMGLIEYGDGNVESGTFEVSAYRLDDDHLVVQYRNVTEREGLLADLAGRNAELERLRDKLVASNEELQRFACVASHDLQAPARRVAAFCDLISDTPGLPPETQKFLGYAVTASRGMMTLIQDLLDYARADQDEFSVGPVPIGPSLERSTDSLQVEIEESGAELVLPNTDASVQATPTLVDQLLTNLIGNAVRYRRPQAAHRVEVRVEDEGEFIRIDVQDNGIGFRQEDVDRMFQPFIRLVGGAYKGTGIGLALCARLVTRLGGSIEASGVPDEGATLSIRLPASLPGT